MRGWAYGLLRLTPETFRTMRLGEFWEALRAYQEEKNMDRRHIGELVRGATLRLFNLQVKQKDRLADPRKFWPMPWDEPDDATAAADRLNGMSKEERDAAARKFLEQLGD